MSNEIQFLLYNMPDSDGKIQVVVKDETLSVSYTHLTLPTSSQV